MCPHLDTASDMFQLVWTIDSYWTTFEIFPSDHQVKINTMTEMFLAGSRSSLHCPGRLWGPPSGQWIHAQLVKHLFESGLLDLSFLFETAVCLLCEKHLGVTYFSIFFASLHKRETFDLLTQHASAVKILAFRGIQSASFFIHIF
jgi:hypothetical protein